MFTKHNCLNLIPTLKNDSVDAIITDPPYHTTNLNFDKKEKVDWGYLFEQLHRVCKKDGAIVIFSQQPFTTDLINANRNYFRYEIIWEKSLAMGFLDANRKPLRAHENIIVFSEKGYAKYNPQKTQLCFKKKTRIKQANNALIAHLSSRRRLPTRPR